MVALALVALNLMGALFKSNGRLMPKKYRLWRGRQKRQPSSYIATGPLLNEQGTVRSAFIIVAP
jgi:hypothetical protein